MNLADELRRLAWEWLNRHKDVTATVVHETPPSKLERALQRLEKTAGSVDSSGSAQHAIRQLREAIALRQAQLDLDWVATEVYRIEARAHLVWEDVNLLKDRILKGMF